MPRTPAAVKEKYDTADRAAATVGQRGQTVIPATLRTRYGLEEGQLVVFEAREEGLLIRPATALPLETYTPTRKAELLLNNATDAADYAAAREAVRALGLDPDDVKHTPPPDAPRKPSGKGKGKK